MDANAIIELLNLRPHPEGGFFRETYRCGDMLPPSVFPGRYDSQRACSTSIYYLLSADNFSCMHRVASDEFFHFYLGDSLEMLQLHPDGTGQVIVIGNNIVAGERPQVLIRRGTWQGSRLVSGGKYALIGATVSPGFEFADYEEGERAALASAYPQFASLVSALTRK